MKYVDVVLPLPLEGVFTYSLPEAMREKNLFGYRVLVPLGRSKTYTAMAVRCHDDKPAFQVRDIISILDDKPILLEQQYRLWSWISNYYMSPLGEVYKAALPSGLKAEDGYKPKTEQYVGLSEKFRSEEALHMVLDSLNRSFKQQQLLTDFLFISHWDSLERTVPQEEIKEVTREELMNVSRTTAPILKALIDKGILYSYKREVGRIDSGGDYAPQKMKALSEAQQNAFEALRDFKGTALLHGVTSAGKTEVYIHLINEAISQGKQVLYLLPEIALTVQIMQRLKSVFGGRLGIYHSKYSDAERVEIWKKQLSDEPYDVILGARSAVFLPFTKLGLVIIDEEHESSYKQVDPAPRYHARSVALVLARMYGARTVLGTATPSTETYYNATTGKYKLVELTTRYRGVSLPDVEIVDIKDLRRRKMMTGSFSPQLIAAMREALDKKMQVILFQNRRGFSQMLECKTCGWVPKCTNCDVSLTYHRNMNQLTCHYCGYTYAVPVSCPSCEEKNIRGRGVGTEKVEDEIRNLFPEARVARMDLDTTRTRNAYSRIINDFSVGATDILIGTQMVTKGLDFDRVSVVGILDADTMLNMPDFRAYEHAFMMMSQVAGRAGRKGQKGRVLLQTRQPDVPVVNQVVKSDYKGFFKELLEERQFFHYPPFTHLIYIYIKHAHETVAESAAVSYALAIKQGLGNRVLGPDKPGVARVKQQNIRKILLKLENGLSLDKVKNYLKQCEQQLLQEKRFATVVIYYDVDP